jgi:excisionase family DNA binding protein
MIFLHSREYAIIFSRPNPGRCSMDGRLITTKEAAAILEVNPRHVARLIREGKIKGEKIGRDHLINVDDVMAYKKNRPRGGWQKGRPRKK